MPQNTPQQADDGWLSALKARDAATIVDFLDPDYALVLVHPRTAVVPRDEWLRTLTDYVISRFDIRGDYWDIRTDLALHLQLVDMDAAVFGTDRSGLFAITDTWLRGDDGNWRVWRRHSTPMSAGELPRP